VQGFLVKSLYFLVPNLLNNIKLSDIENKTLKKYSFIGITNNDFLLESATSDDQGKNWQTNEKFFFKRNEK